MNNKIYALIDRLSNVEKKEFNCDVLQIKWVDYLQTYMRGMQIWVQGYDTIVPEAKLNQILVQTDLGRDNLDLVL